MSGMKPEEMLSHGDFVRALSRKLVMDEHASQDITQQTWLAALENPPSDDKPVRAWLYKVTRYLSSKFHRKEQRRLKRERSTAREETVLPPDEVAEREETRRRVVDAVQSLNEPYRSTILFRYFEELSTREMAKRFDVPHSTVRIRLKRGLDRLRAKLDADFGGSRKRWIMALAPLAGLPATATAGTATSTAALAGALALGTKVKFAAGVLFAVGVIFVLWRMTESDDDSPLKNSITSDGSFRAPDAESLSTTGSANAVAWEPKLLTREKIEPSDMHPLAAESDYTTLRGHAYDYTGKPLSGSSVCMVRIETFQDAVRTYPMLYTRSDGEGFFEFNDLLLGRYILRLGIPKKGSNPWHFEYMDLKELVLDEPGIVEEELRLDDQGATLSGMIIEKKTGEPLLNEAITLWAARWRETGKQYRTTVNPEDGTFHLRCLPKGTYDLHVEGPGLYRDSLIGVNAEAGEVTGNLRFRIPSLGKINVILEGLQKEEKMDLSVIALPDMEFPVSLERFSEELYFAEGRKEVYIGNRRSGLFKSTVVVTAEEPATIVVRREDLITPKKGDVKIDGTLRTANGSPVTDAEIYFSEFTLWGDIDIEVSCTTDDQGRFSGKGLRPGRWIINCLRLGRTPDTGKDENDAEACGFQPWVSTSIDDIVIPENPDDSYTLDLAMPAGTVRGTLCEAQSGVPLNGEILPWDIHVVDNNRLLGKWIGRQTGRENRFALAGLPPGEYHLVIHSPGYAKRRSAPFRLGAGEERDLGGILLTPTGLIDLEIVDADGTTLNRQDFNSQEFRLTCKGRSIKRNRTHYVERGFRVDDLPMGQQKITAGLRMASGKFETLEKTIYLNPGRPTKVRFVFEGRFKQDRRRR